MKRLFTLLFLTVLFYGAHAQLRLGILGGPHGSSIKETNSIPAWGTEVEPYITKRSGVNVGIIGEMPLGYSKRLYFQPGIFFMNKGRKYQRFFDTTVTHNDTLFSYSQFYTNYIDIPLNLTLKLPMGKKSSFLISAGPYLSFFYSGSQTHESRVQINDSAVEYRKIESGIDVGKDVEKATTFDLGFNVRAGFEIGSVLLTGFMSQGLVNFYNAPYDGTFKHRVVGASVGFWLSKRVEQKPSDRDGDGIPDKSDACPDIAGIAATGGCPDQDGDGIADAVDKCPTVVGVPRYKGCPIPDTDGDGINDDEDKCLTKAGIAKYQGCPIPDTDGDGVNDEEDKCPAVAGAAENNGCPWPDTDGDGVLDKDDKCPAQAGVKENNGCPVIKKEIVEKVTFAAKKIFFNTGSDKLSTASYAPLNQVAEILKANPELRMNIEGHSDNAGNPVTNLTLSQKRADAVKAYLVKKGIDSNRLDAKGFGQEQPVADNSTPAGRAANRRVELEVSQ